MAIREKTVIFAFPMTTTQLTDATVTNLNQITLYIPEASPTFTSVFAEVGFQDAITASGGTITEHRVGLRLGAAAYTTFTETDDITNSGENLAGVLGPIDFTSHFNANWTGTSMTCDGQVYFDQNTGATQGMRNVTMVLYVTYEYDDTAATQIKTVRIPLESLIDGLPTTATNFGTNQIPQLTGAGGILPEAGVTIRDYFFLIEGNETVVSNTTDFTISANIDGGTSTNFQTQESGLASDRFCRWIYAPAVPNTATTHNLQLRSTLANRCRAVTVTLCVTYQFTLSGTSRVLNSILLPIEIGSPLGLTTAAEASRFVRDVFLVEPGSLTLRQSAVRVNYNCPANPSTINVKAGNQSYRTYITAGNVVCGMFSLQQRIDSGAAEGAGISIFRGHNSFVLDAYTTSATVEVTNINGYILLNYESDLAAGGIGSHANTTMRVLLPWDAQLSDLNRITNYAHPITDSNYWNLSVGFLFTQWVATNNMALTYDVECLAGESKGAGYQDIYADAYTADNERACSMVWMRGRDVFKRFSEDTDPDRLDIELARDYRLYTSVICGNGITASITRHTHTWAAAGTISGHDPALSTNLRLVVDSTGQVLQEQTLTAGTTSFSFTVYDDTEDYYIDAYQDNSYVGRSGLAKAV